MQYRELQMYSIYRISICKRYKVHLSIKKWVPFLQEREWTTVAIQKQPKVKNLTNVHELFPKGLKPSLILDGARERHDMLWKRIIIKKNN